MNECIFRGGSVKIVFVFLQQMGLLLKERIRSRWEQILSFKSAPSFQKWLGEQEIKQEVTKLPPL